MSKTPTTLIQYDKSLPYIDGREPYDKPDSHLIKDGINSYKIKQGRRRSTMLLVNKIRKEVDEWRKNDYPDVTKTTRELLNFWFDTDHWVKNEIFKYWFCEREAIETLIYLYEVMKFRDLGELVDQYAVKTRKGLIGPAVQVKDDASGSRTLYRFFPNLQKRGVQDFPAKNLLRFAFKMATGTGKTYVMALVIVWSYFNYLYEDKLKYSKNFLIVAPNVIVYERLAKDFADQIIFNDLPIIPHHFLPDWNVKVTLRGDDSPLNPSGNIIVNNIHQIYESRSKKWSPKTIVDAFLGRKPQKNLTKSPYFLLDKIKALDNLIVMNDEGHHIYNEKLNWYKILLSINKAIIKGLTLWLDFSATPKFLSDGTYFPWIIVDYPLAQAIEDRIIKSPLIVHQINREDPEVASINNRNVAQKFGDWIVAALERWKEHYNVYSQIGKKPVLFIMAERKEYANSICNFIKQKRSNYGLAEDEILVIHTSAKGEYYKKDLKKLRKIARDIDKPNNKIKIIVSVLMLKEGWDVQNVTIILGLRPFTSKGEILPEQAVGRGLRLMRDMSPDHTQTLEIIGTKGFENVVKKLEIEGAGVNTVNKAPSPIVIISPEKSRNQYDIEIPNTEFRYTRNYKNIANFDISKVQSLYKSDKLDEKKKIELKMEFPVTETDVHVTEITKVLPLSGRELIAFITQSVIKRAHLATGFNIIYPIIQNYILNKCFETNISGVDYEKLRRTMTNPEIQEAIIELLSKELGNLTSDTIPIVIKPNSIILSETPSFPWRRPHVKCKKTVFNLVAVFNNFEEEFAKFLDKFPDIEKFAAITKIFKIDYLSSKGSIRFYLPDFVAVQKTNKKEIYWIIETKGREYPDTDLKDAAMKNWCDEISKQTKEEWKYIKVLQREFNRIKQRANSFSYLINHLN